MGAVSLIARRSPPRRLLTIGSVAALLAVATGALFFTSPSGALPLLSARASTLVASPMLFVYKGDVWVMDNGQSSQLTHRGNAANPSFSPDGSKIVYVTVGQNYSQIWMMNADGSDQQQLTANSSAVIDNNIFMLYPTWTSDGQNLVVQSDKNLSPQGVTDQGIWEYNLANQTWTDLTNPFTGQYYGAGGDAEPAPCPANPDLIAFTRFTYSGQNPPYDSVIEMLNTQTMVLTPMTPALGQALQPAWSSDGTRLAYIQRVADTDSLIVAGVSGVTGGATPSFTITQTLQSGLLGAPAFDKNADAISYFAIDHGRITLFVLPISATSAGVQTLGGPTVLLRDDQLDSSSAPSWNWSN